MKVVYKLKSLYVRWLLLSQRQGKGMGFLRWRTWAFHYSLFTLGDFIQIVEPQLSC